MLSESRPDGTNREYEMDLETLVRLYRAMVAARKIDELEEQAVRRGEAFFHVSGAGHEGVAALAPHLIDEDYLYLHYRSKALMVARGSPLRMFFDMLFCKDASPSRGRQMSAHLCDAERNILSTPGPVGNCALQAVGIAAAAIDRPARPIVVCCVGDGSTQQGEFLESLGEAGRSRLPVMFVIEDNQWAISTNTAGKTFYSLHGNEPIEFHGVPIRRIDGRDAATAVDQFAPIVAGMRQDRGPQVVVLRVERLSHHTNADDQSIYRQASDLQRAAASGDPVRRLEQHLLSRGYSAERMQALHEHVEAEVRQAEEQAYCGNDPQPTFTAKAPLAVQAVRAPSPSSTSKGQDRSRLPMKDALREVLRHHLLHDSRVVLFGEDIEDPKGDVFGLTRGLSSEFPGRVINSPLTESTIVGVSVGRALAGQKPVAFLQFADFLPLAMNQLLLELATMWWRTDGAWTAPVVGMVPCGGYRPGLGPFHSHSLESVLAHTPGLDVFMPSDAADAAGMLNAALASGRPSLVFYPKAALNDPQRATSIDVTSHIVPVGTARRVRRGRDLTFVAWGNTVPLCQRAADALEEASIEAEVIDLRSISPWDEATVLASVEQTARAIVVHEDNHTCGLGAEIVATIAEKARVPVAVRRVTRADTFVPCHYPSQVAVLPSARDVLTCAADLLGLSLTWEEPQQVQDGLFSVDAIGSGPSDESVTVVELFVSPGDEVEKGTPVAELEATKGIFELYCPVSGKVEAILSAVGDSVPVGQTMLKIRTAGQGARAKPMTQEPFGKPILSGQPTQLRYVGSPNRSERVAYEVGLAAVASVTGNRDVSNRELLASQSEVSEDDIVRRTGIVSRCWVDEDQDALSMGQAAARRLLETTRLGLDQIDLVICTTTSPTTVSPSMACRIIDGLATDQDGILLQAYDINAACSGYLYALQSAYDYLQSKPDGRVMIVTTEVLSPLLDPEDLHTAIIFSDAASATLVYGQEHIDRTCAKLSRPELSAKCEDGSLLSVPLNGNGYIRMQGVKVFSEAVRYMMGSLTRACRAGGLEISDLKVVIPHQANGRIVDAIQKRIDVDVYSNIHRLGNTSSTSIPLCLKELLPQLAAGERIGLCAFGAGFTFGAAVLERTAVAPAEAEHAA